MNDRIRICLAAKDFPFRTGVGTAVYILGKALRKEGHHVVILTCAKEGEENRRVFEDLIVYEVLPRTFPLSLMMSLGIRSPFLRTKFGIEAGDIFSLKIGLRYRDLLLKIKTEEKLQIVEFPDSFCEGYFSLKKGILPSCLRVQSPRYLWQHLGVSSDPINPVMEKIEKESFKLADLLLVPSEDMRENVTKFYNIVPDELKIIPNFVDTDSFVPMNKRTDEPFVLFVGRIEPLKGVHTLAKSIPIILNKLPKVYFIFIGDSGKNPLTGKLYSQEILENLKEERFQKQVKIVPRLPREKLIRYYQQCSLVVVPSLCESLSYSALEGMACGKPVVASNVGGLTESINNNVTGFLVPPLDFALFAEKILTLIESSALRQDMGIKGRERVENLFSAKAVIPRLTGFYSSII